MLSYISSSTLSLEPLVLELLVGKLKWQRVTLTKIVLEETCDIEITSEYWTVYILKSKWACLYEK